MSLSRVFRVALQTWLGTSLALLGSGLAPAGESDPRTAAAVCLNQARQLLGISDDLGRLRAAMPEAPSIADVAQVATAFGCVATAQRVSVGQPFAYETPAIAKIGESDFVTIAAIDADERRLFLLHGSSAAHWETLDDFLGTWSGELVLLQPALHRLGPRLWADSNTVSVGELGRIAGQRRQFTVLNIGSEPLELVVAKASCSCTSVNAPRAIAPKSFANVDLMIDTSRKEPGPFSASVTLVTNETEEPVHKFRLSGLIAQSFAFYPTIFNLGEISPNGSERLLVTTGRFSDHASAQLVFVGSSPGVRLDSLESADGRWQIGLLVQPLLLARAEDGVVVGGARFETGLTEAPYLDISIDGRLLPVLSTAPTAVFLGRTTSGAQFTRKLSIESHVSGVMSVGVSDEKLVRIVAFDEDSVDLLITAPTTEGIFKAAAWIVKGDYRISVPIMGMVGAD